ncbi:MAG TPA: FHA domain-containing protein [Thermoanaerobaculia bacterium]|nr:FHA domain-containing protein [Thermoanaerobaculia bacterium]
MTAYLIVENGGGTKHEIVGRAVIGRDAECEIQLSNLSVSRRHAAIEETASGFLLKDLSSINGTFLRGKKVTDAALTGGDDLRFGDVKAVFRIEENRTEVSGTGKLLQTLSVKPVRRARPVAVVIVTLAGIALLVAATIWSKTCGGGAKSSAAYSSAPR